MTRMSGFLRSAAIFGAGTALGGVLVVAGLARAGRLAEPTSRVLVPLAQRLDAEHRRVDLLLDAGDVEGALEVLEALREGPWPSPDEGGHLGLQLRHDAYGRLVRLGLDQRPEDDRTRLLTLEGWISEGLGAGSEEIEANPFTARLWALKGEALEALGRDSEALAAYEVAIAMNQVLLERELGGAP